MIKIVGSDRLINEYIADIIEGHYEPHILELQSESLEELQNHSKQLGEADLIIINLSLSGADCQSKLKLIKTASEAQVIALHTYASGNLHSTFIAMGASEYLSIYSSAEEFNEVIERLISNWKSTKGLNN
ncbi:MAG: hypothetical protein AAFX87_05225 [Bacteroidota bacterium]